MYLEEIFNFRNILQFSYFQTIVWPISGSTPPLRTTARASTAPEHCVHKGGAQSQHHRELGGLPGHHRELPEGGAGQEVSATCGQELEGKSTIKIQTGERERGPPFTYLTKEKSSSVTEGELPRKNKELERKNEIKDRREEDKKEEEEETVTIEEESGSKKMKKTSQKKFKKYSFLESSSRTRIQKSSRDQVYLDSDGVEIISSSSSSLPTSSSSSSGDSQELQALLGSRGSSPAGLTNGTLCASNVSCAAEYFKLGRRQEQPPTNVRGQISASVTLRLQPDNQNGGKHRNFLEPEPGDRQHST